MISPESELLPALIALLKADAGVKALFEGGKVLCWDWPPVNAQEPYLVIANMDAVASLAEGMDCADTAVTVTAWARTKPTPTLKDAQKLAKAVVEAVKALGDLPSFRVTCVGEPSSESLFDIDGETAKAVVRFEVATEPS